MHLEGLIYLLRMFWKLFFEVEKIFSLGFIEPLKRKLLKGLCGAEIAKLGLRRPLVWRSSDTSLVDLDCGPLRSKVSLIYAFPSKAHFICFAKIKRSVVPINFTQGWTSALKSKAFLCTHSLVLALICGQSLIITINSQVGFKHQLNPACWIQAGLNDSTVFHLIPPVKYKRDYMTVLYFI